MRTTAPAEDEQRQEKYSGAGGWPRHHYPTLEVFMRIPVFTLLVALLIAGCDQPAPTGSATVPVDARAPGATTTNKPVAPDNTAVNERDARANTKTPIDQNENQADVNVTAKIRQQVLDVKDLSINARNAKIITADGKVTLRGPVNSEEERNTLERIAVAVAGEGKVDNQLEVSATSTVPR